MSITLDTDKISRYLFYGAGVLLLLTLVVPVIEDDTGDETENLSLFDVLEPLGYILVLLSIASAAVAAYFATIEKPPFPSLYPVIGSIILAVLPLVQMISYDGGSDDEAIQELYTVSFGYFIYIIGIILLLAGELAPIVIKGQESKTEET